MAHSVISAIPAYAMQTAYLPTSVCTEIDKLCRSFIWGNTERNRKIALINWDKVQKPKESGGLSFRGAKSTNYAFLMKLAWGILTNHQALWVQVLHSKYKVKDSDFSCHLQNAHCSNLWRGIAAVWVSLSKVLSGLWEMGS